MEWINRLNDAITYMEENLAGTIEMERAAQAAACSVFHFQRMFPYVTGVTLGEYIRRRRLTLAAFELMNADKKVVDIAAKYGYESPTAFNRAFQAIHGVNPTAAKANGVCLTAFPRITFSISIKGESAMTYKIEKKKAFRIVGVKTEEPMTMENCFEKVPVFWGKITREGWIPKICELMDSSEPVGLLGMSACDGGEFSGYYIAAATSRPCPEGMTEYIVPAGTWAVFECTGPMPEAMQHLQKRIFSEWLPTSDYDYAPAPDIEVYFEGDQSAADYRSQVWMPIVKKEN